MIIDCGTCAAPAAACSDCLVNVLLGPVTSGIAEEHLPALEHLADSGLIPPLRLVGGDPAPRRTA